MPLQGPSPSAAQRLAAPRVLGISSVASRSLCQLLRPHGTIKRDFVLEPSVSMFLARSAAPSRDERYTLDVDKRFDPSVVPLVDKLEPPIAAGL